MNTLTAGAAMRQTLTLNYEGKPQPCARDRKRRSPTLTTQELRRLVALMVD
jgi:hypothetical protein